jgi:hypothetical protein
MAKMKNKATEYLMMNLVRVVAVFINALSSIAFGCPVG